MVNKPKSEKTVDDLDHELQDVWQMLWDTRAELHALLLLTTGLVAHLQGSLGFDTQALVSHLRGLVAAPSGGVASPVRQEIEQLLNGVSSAQAMPELLARLAWPGGAGPAD